MEVVPVIEENTFVGRLIDVSELHPLNKKPAFFTMAEVQAERSMEDNEEHPSNILEISVRCGEAPREGAMSVLSCEQPSNIQ